MDKLEFIEIVKESLNQAMNDIDKKHLEAFEEFNKLWEDVDEVIEFK